MEGFSLVDLILNAWTQNYFILFNSTTLQNTPEHLLRKLFEKISPLQLCWIEEIASRFGIQLPEHEYIWKQWYLKSSTLLQRTSSQSFYFSNNESVDWKGQFIVSKWSKANPLFMRAFNLHLEVELTSNGRYELLASALAILASIDSNASEDKSVLEKVLLALTHYGLLSKLKNLDTQDLDMDEKSFSVLMMMQPYLSKLPVLKLQGRYICKSLITYLNNVLSSNTGLELHHIQLESVPLIPNLLSSGIWGSIGLFFTRRLSLNYKTHMNHLLNANGIEPPLDSKMTPEYFIMSLLNAPNQDLVKFSLVTSPLFEGTQQEEISQIHFNLGRFLANAPSLRSLFICDNHLSDATLALLVSSSKCLNELSIQEEEIGLNTSLAIMNLLMVGNLCILSLTANTFIMNQETIILSNIVKGIRGCPSLRQFHVSGSLLTMGGNQEKALINTFRMVSFESVILELCVWPPSGIIADFLLAIALGRTERLSLRNVLFALEPDITTALSILISSQYLKSFEMTKGFRVPAEIFSSLSYQSFSFLECILFFDTSMDPIAANALCSMLQSHSYPKTLQLIQFTNCWSHGRFKSFLDNLGNPSPERYNSSNTLQDKNTLEIKLTMLYHEYQDYQQQLEAWSRFGVDFIFDFTQETQHNPNAIDGFDER